MTHLFRGGRIEDARMNAYYHTSIYTEDNYYVRFFQYLILDAIGDLFNRLVCRLYGHQIIDEGDATPEHGYVALSCERCGREWPTVHLY